MKLAEVKANSKKKISPNIFKGQIWTQGSLAMLSSMFYFEKSPNVHKNHA